MSPTSSSAHPRVLVVGQPFNWATGGGITLSSLFEGWPRDRLASVAFPGPPRALDVCDRVYVLGTGEIGWVWPLSHVSRSETPVSNADTHGPSGPPATAPTEGPSRQTAKELFRAAVGWLGIDDVLRTMHISDELRDWIADFKPDLIYSQLHDLPLMTLLTEILDTTDLPLAIHIMDDWPSSMYRTGALAGPVRMRAERVRDALFRRSKGRMAIGDAMAEEYLRRYGMAFVPIQKSVDLDRQDALTELHRLQYQQPEGSPVQVVYSGRIGHAVGSSLLTVAEVISDMANAGIPVCLRLYTSDCGNPVTAQLARLESVEVCSPVPYDHVPALLATADVLLIAIDFDDESMEFIRLSMPTKIPDYMASGRPVLMYAPRGSAAAECARLGGWSLLVDQPDAGQVREALAALVGDAALRHSLGARGRSLVAERHAAAVVRASFAEELVRAVERHDAPADSPVGAKVVS